MSQGITSVSAPRERQSGNSFDLLKLTFQDYEIRALSIGGQAWFAWHDILVILPYADELLGRLRRSDVIEIDMNKLSRGHTAIKTSEGPAIFVSEPGAMLVCTTKSALDVADWIVSAAGPTIRAAGAWEARMETLPLVRTRCEVGQRPDKRMTSHVLYRMMDENENLLYVGISMASMQRMLQHRATKVWFHKVVHVRFEHFKTREAAMAAEHLAIATEGPRYNIAS